MFPQYACVHIGMSIGGKRRRALNAQPDQLLGTRNGYRPEQQRINCREHERVGADAEGQQRHYECGEPRRPRKRPYGLPQICNNLTHIVAIGIL